MPSTKLTDEEIECRIMDMIYGGGHYSFIELEVIKDELKGYDIHKWDLERIWNDLNKQGLVEIKSTKLNISMLTGKGMRIMRKHGNYRAYLEYKEKQEGKKERIDRKDRRIKTIGILATLIISLLTLISTQYTTQQDIQQKKIEEGIQSVAKELDSLKQVLRSTQKVPQSAAVKDTATNK